MVGIPKIRKTGQEEGYENYQDIPPVVPAPALIHGQDVLSVLRIPLQTTLDDDILSPSEIKTTAFRARRPEGYNYDDVDAWYRQVVKTIDWYAARLHSRDLDVHRLATEIDKNIADMTNLKYEMELANTPLNSNEDILALRLELQRKDDEIAKLRDAFNTALPAKNTTSANTSSLTEQEREQFTALQEWAAQVEVSYAEMEKQLASSLAEKGVLENRLIEIEKYTREIEAYADQLEKSMSGTNPQDPNSAVITPVVDSAPLAAVEPVVQPIVPVEAVELYTEPMPSGSEEDGIVFDSDFMRSSELPDGITIPPLSTSVRKDDQQEYEPFDPHAPLKSIPQNARVEDYL